MTAPVRVGVVGVGAIAVALVDALLTGPRAGDVSVVVSPRSAVRAAGLAARHAAVHVAAGNQEVLDGSDVVVLAVLPGQVADVCAALRFRAGHVVVNLAAGWPPSVLAPHVAPAVDVCQLIPLPVIALHTGPVVLYPGLPAVADLLEGCGELVVLERESDVMVLNCVSAAMSSFFELQKTLVGWATGAGLPERAALDYVTALFQGLSAEAVAERDRGLGTMPVEHETPGGLNEQVRLALTAHGTFTELTRQLDDLLRTRVMASRTD